MSLKKKIRKYIFLVLGVVSAGLGIAGIVLPLLPTTPFLLLSAFLFYRSSNKFYSWLINSKVLGEYIYNYRTYKAIKRRAKITAISTLWITLLVSFFLVQNLYVHILLSIIGIAVTIHLMSIKTIENMKDPV